MLSEAAFKAFAPKADTAAWVPALNAACQAHGITTDLRIAHFMAQTGEETGGYTVFVENLDYSAAALLRQWPRHFPTPEIAEAYARNPVKIANRAYAGRYGNGDEASGDGYQFRGRDPIQHTFRNGYVAAAMATGVDCVTSPDLLLEPVHGAMAAASYWAANGCNELADKDDVVAITQRVNGGLINLDHRKAMLVLWRHAVAAQPAIGIPISPAQPSATDIARVLGAPGQTFLGAASPTPPLPPVSAPVEPPTVKKPPVSVPVAVASLPKPTITDDDIPMILGAGAGLVALIVAGWIAFTALFRRPKAKASVPAPVVQPHVQTQKAPTMSDLSATIDNFESLLEGKSDFNEFIGDEGALIEKNIASLAAPLQPAVQLLYASFKAGASGLVGAGLTAVGPILAQNTDDQATEVLNLLSVLGVPTRPPLNIAEQAVLVTAINGLKAGLDRIGIHIATSGQVSVAPAASAPALSPVPAGAEA